MFFDRLIAKNEFKKNLSNINKEWIIIAGNRGVGKTAFIEEITNSDSTIHCKSTKELLYWRNFFNKIKKLSEKILLEYIKIIKNGETLYDDYVNYTAELTELQYENILENLLKNEIDRKETILSKVIGKFLQENIKYIVLDDIYLCDYKSYEWLVSLSEAFISNSNYLIVICDLDVYWQSQEVKGVFKNTLISIDISRFDDEKAYYDILKNKIYFKNSITLESIAKNLYYDFKGDSCLLFKLIDIVNSKITAKTTEEDKVLCIYKTAGVLISDYMEEMNSFQKNILALLSLSPVPLDIKSISKILEHDKNNIKKCLNNLITDNLVEIDIDTLTGHTIYKCGKILSKTACRNMVSESLILYYQNKIYTLYNKNKIQLSDSQLINLILQLKPDDLNEKILTYINKHGETIDNEFKAMLINIIIEGSSVIPLSISNLETIDLLYTFGYYSSAKKIFKSFNNFYNNYNLLMKYGSILHLTLDYQTASIYERASNIKNISISEKLSAINRQIMAMTQQTKKDLDNARILYQSTIEKYSSNNCKGMAELYRNANNIYEYNESMKYTILGYNMACLIEDDLEQIKCLQNICMLELLNGTYNSDHILEGLESKPQFEDVYDMLLKYPNFSHETAYPLLDMANNEMFKYDETDDTRYLNSAKSFYSEAQLYSKSFYAKNISEMGLLIVNSYLYPESQNLKELRRRQFNDYLEIKESIHDFRVHRKKLFSFATSAIITNDIDEAKMYLLLAKEHVFEGEILRFNNLCKELKMFEEIIPLSDVKINKITNYHTTIKFVPWLISFGH